jgi:hypothetical protein
MTSHALSDLDTRPASQRRPGPPGGSTWRGPVALVILSIVPVAAGSLRPLEIINVIAEWAICRPGIRIRTALAVPR